MEKNQFSFRYMQDALKQMENQFHVVDFVSFDLFDTLIWRKNLFSPKDLFYLVKEKVKRQLGLHLDNFTAFRVRAEEIARVRAWGRGFEEVTIHEIYADLSRLLDLDIKDAQRVLQIELECERLTLSELESGKQLFRAALLSGKPIIVIADTYFDKKFITEIIKEKGYGDVSKVYVSSDYRKTKLEGSLYNVVLKDLRCSPDRLLHIGDNHLSDVKKAISRGLRVLFLPTPKHRLKWHYKLGDMPSGNLVLSTMLCKLSKKFAKEFRSDDLQSILRKTAIQNLSILYLAFSAWLVEQLKTHGCNRVYFASREGLIMKRFFDLVSAADGLKINTKYLYVSRMSLYPSLIFTAPKTARHLFSQNWDRLTIENALRRVSLNFKDCADLLRKHRLADLKMQLDNSTVSQFLTFLDDVWSILEYNNEERYKVLVDYLKQEMVLTDEKAAFVDIGWHGSLQNCIIKLLDHLSISKDLVGYYLGTFEKPRGVAPNFNAKGFLVDNNEPKWISKLVRSGPSLIEIFHGTGHGCVIGYKRNNSRVSPVLEDNPEEREQFETIIEPIQNIAYDFVSEHLKRFQDISIKSSSPALAARVGLRVIYDPTKEEAKAFGLLKIATDFGAKIKSITGGKEWDLKKIDGEKLPDRTLPIWEPGFKVLKGL